MREEEDDLPCYDVITYSLLRTSNHLHLKLSSTAHSIQIPTQGTKDTTKNTSTNSITKSNPLNRLKSIKINDTLT